MAKRNDPVARARGRKAAPVKKPFPMGMVLGSTALGGVLIAILVYAFMNQGVGDKSSLKYAESAIDGLVTNHDLSNNHRPAQGFQKINYPDEATTPPMGGDHNPTPQSCQVYTTPIANEFAVHSLEHGAVWITYNPETLPKGDVDKLKDKVDGDPYRMLSPYPGLKSKISLQAWGEQLFVESVGDDRIDEFLDLFTSGPQAPERGAACTGTTAPRPPDTSVNPTPAATTSASPSRSATPSPTASPR